MGELDITIHTRDLAPCFSATPSHCQIVSWKAYPETPSRKNTLKKTRGGLIAQRTGTDRHSRHRTLRRSTSSCGGVQAAQSGETHKMRNLHR